jgi:hypothetical protein
MAGGATHSFVHVNTVVEKDMVGQTRHPVPLQRHATGIALDHWPKLRRICQQLRMTSQARLGRWHAREGRRFHGSVAIAAIDPEFARVFPVAERHGLRWRKTDSIPRCRVEIR